MVMVARSRPSACHGDCRASGGHALATARRASLGGTAHERLRRAEPRCLCGHPVDRRLCRAEAPTRTANQHPARDCDTDAATGARPAAGAAPKKNCDAPPRGQDQAGHRNAGDRPADRFERERDPVDPRSADASRRSGADEAMGLSGPELHDQRNALSRRRDARIPCPLL